MRETAIIQSHARKSNTSEDLQLLINLHYKIEKEQRNTFKKFQLLVCVNQQKRKRNDAEKV